MVLITARRRPEDDGAVAVLVAVVVVAVVLPLMAIVVDLGLARVLSSRARVAADAAALAAAARKLGTVGDQGSDVATAAAKTLVGANLPVPDGGWDAAWASCEDPDPLPAGTDPVPGNCISFDAAIKQVRVTVPGTPVPSAFAGVLGSAVGPATATSTASWGNKISPAIGSCALCVLGAYSTGAQYVVVSGGDAATDTLTATYPGRLLVSGGGITFATSWISFGGYLSFPPVKRPVQDPFGTVLASLRASAPGGLYDQPSRQAPAGPCSPGIYQSIDPCTAFGSGIYYVTGNPSTTLSMSLKVNAPDVVLFFTCSAWGPGGTVLAKPCPSGQPPRFTGAAGGRRTLSAPNGTGPALVFDQGLSRNEFLSSDQPLVIVGDVYGPDVTLRPRGTGTASVQGRVVVKALTGNSSSYRRVTMLRVDLPPVPPSVLVDGAVRLVRSG